MWFHGPGVRNRNIRTMWAVNVPVAHARACVCVCVSVCVSVCVECMRVGMRRVNVFRVLIVFFCLCFLFLSSPFS